MSDRNLFSKIERNGSIDYMLRTTQQHHVQLSLMADQKAHIMVAANTVLITLAIGTFDFEKPVWALLSLIIFSFFALLFAILAVYPSTRKGLTNTIKNSRPNWLFFGTFTNYDYDDFSSNMAKIMQKDESVYEAMVNDIYQLGIALKETKYKYIRSSYRIFFLGLLFTLLAYLGQVSDAVGF